MNTTIFLELILVIVGETLEDEMGYDPTFTVPITRSFLEESWDYSPYKSLRPVTQRDDFKLSSEFFKPLKGN